jgi:hypothetical protein
MMQMESTNFHIGGEELQNIPASNQLNGNYYFKWSQIVNTLLKGKGKQSHILGNGPKKEDPRFTTWDEEDSMIMAWLWNSMIPKISDTCVCFSTAKDSWDALKQTYSKESNAAQVYEIWLKAISAKQSNRSITE